MTKRPPDHPDAPEPGIDLDRLEQRGIDLVRKRRREYQEGPLATPAGAVHDTSPWDRFRAFFTFRRVSLALNVVFLLVILAAARDRYLYSPYPLEVHIGQYAGTMRDDTARELVTVREVTGNDGERKTIWARSFPGLVIQARVAPWRHSALDPKPRYLVVANLEYGKPGTLSVWDIRAKNPDRQMLWERKVSLSEIESVFPAEMAKGQGAWCNGFTLADLDGDDEPEIAAMFHHDQYFPACIRTFERDGTVRGTYWNWGYFDAIAKSDVDQDGREEIVASGTNNVFQGGTLVMLDADHLSGYSMDDDVARRLTKAGFGDRLGREPFLEGARNRVVLPLWHEEVAAFCGSNRIHAGSLAPIETPPSFMVTVGIGVPSAWKAARATALGVPRPSPKYWVSVQVDATLRPLRMVVPDGFLEILRLARESGQIRIEADTNAHWQEWVDSYVHYGADGASSPGSAPAL